MQDKIIIGIQHWIIDSHTIPCDLCVRRRGTSKSYSGECCTAITLYKDRGIKR
mgnify:CR=1 FL=1